jgi:hypothetical protein
MLSPANGKSFRAVVSAAGEAKLLAVIHRICTVVPGRPDQRKFDAQHTGHTQNAPSRRMTFYITIERAAQMEKIFFHVGWATWNNLPGTGR